MKKPITFAVTLPAAALIIQFIFLTLLPLSPSANRTAWRLWERVNEPVVLLQWITDPIANNLRLNWGVNLDDEIRTVGTVLLWLVVGFVIDYRKARTHESEVVPTRLTGWHCFTSALISAYAIFLAWFWFELIEFEHDSFLFRSSLVSTILQNLLIAAWCLALGTFFIRNFYFLSTLLERLFHSRPEASWKGYLLLVVVPPLISSDPLEVIVLPALGLIQIKYRTLAGWLLLLGWSLRYTALALITLGLIQNTYNLVFVAFGLVASAGMIAWRPQLRTT